MEYKGFIIKSHPKSPNLKLIVTGGQGGKIPAIFQGAHLSEGACMKLIDGYKAKPKEKVNKNGKANPRTGKL